ncbi:unnamed protein product [Didymodactylos carnosus]|uniref:RRM domain-containing protein n=2 Tax=Didymodactylos carnosus TaxID=1234261 RepID=A0A814KLK8_9BILA|nr:unnamed protein product [Didymodactylos carnosus]CAF3822577.1 unnamed protein product [Didymodactylos carnosus]
MTDTDDLDVDRMLEEELDISLPSTTTKISSNNRVEKEQRDNSSKSHRKDKGHIQSSTSSSSHRHSHKHLKSYKEHKENTDRDKRRSRDRDPKGRKIKREHRPNNDTNYLSKEQTQQKQASFDHQSQSQQRYRSSPSLSKKANLSKARDFDSDLHSISKSSGNQRQQRSRSRDGDSKKRLGNDKSPELSPEERDKRTVLCMQLAARIRPRDLEELFSKIGKVRDVRLITDPRTRRSKGVAYVEFRDLDCVNQAISLSGQKVLGVPIIVKESNAEKNRSANQSHISGQFPFQQSTVPQTGPMKLYVGSLHFNITEEMLRGIFEPFGRIESINLMKDTETAQSRGYAFIQFAHAEDAKRAMENLNGFELAGRPMKVGHVTERVNDGGLASNLDSEELDERGINLGATGRLALMAKLADGSGLQMPQYTLNALNMAQQSWCL